MGGELIQDVKKKIETHKKKSDLLTRQKRPKRVPYIHRTGYDVWRTLIPTFPAAPQRAATSCAQLPSCLGMQARGLGHEARLHTLAPRLGGKPGQTTNPTRSEK